MARRLFSSGSSFEAEIGYSRAVLEGDTLYVSGTTGYDYTTMQIAPDMAAQAEQAFRNIHAVLLEAGFSMQDIVRVTYMVPDRADWPLCWPITRHWLGEVRPAATMIQCGLHAPEMKIEIEITAQKRRLAGEF